MERIKWNGPCFDKEDFEQIKKVLDEEFVSEGSWTKEIESKLGKYLGVQHVIMTSSGTASLYMAIKSVALDKGINDYEVIIPDMTMIATATAVNLAGGTPILVDIERDRLTLNVEDVKKKITNKTVAIVPVHILGRSCDMGKLESLADEYEIAIIEDSAGALGSRNMEGHLGTIGDIGCFSLQSNKIITAGQGGFVTTNNSEYFEKMRRLKDFGRFHKTEFIHEMEGYNFKMGELSAALALGQFNKIDKRRKLLMHQRKIYEDSLGDVSELEFPKMDYEAGEVPLWVDVLAEDRDLLSKGLREKGICTRDCWPAIHKNPPYFQKGNDSDFPIASYVSDKGLWLPNGPSNSDENIMRVCDEIKRFYG